MNKMEVLELTRQSSGNGSAGRSPWSNRASGDISWTHPELRLEVRVSQANQSEWLDNSKKVKQQD